MNTLKRSKTLDILKHGHLEIHGQFVRGSNATLLVHLSDPEGEQWAVYKPIRGETPLWDFPEGSLAAREVAAYLTSETLGWQFVPPTVLRTEAPYGPGSIQQFYSSDPNLHYFTFSQALKGTLRSVALFDILINNADRKGSHLIIDEDANLWLIDHGLTFHQEDKLRTVVWDFAGEPIPENLLTDLQRFISTLSSITEILQLFLALISQVEIDALVARAKLLLSTGCYPERGSQHDFPYPLL